MYIPEGFGTIFPYMIIDGANDFVDFLNNVFEAKEVGRTEFPNGRVANIEVQIGTSRFMIGEPDNEASKPMPASYYVYVDDVDQTLEKAIAHGATKLFGATDMPYQDRQAGVIDPFGNAWWISRRLVEEPYHSD
ncbi:MAG: VOC family protein [Gammaproteobacteria bacterium]|nr:VOC family protein [Gammaproteobacteria bacterium]